MRSRRHRINGLHVITEYRPAGPSRVRRVLFGLAVAALGILAAAWFVIMTWAFYILMGGAP